MLRLRTFGGLSLESDRGPLAGAATQRRRLSVLAVLAEAGERGLTRDKLVGLLWPEVDEAHARSALSQSLYALKRDAGEPQLVLGYDRLALNARVVTADVAEFDEAIARGDLARAAMLYTGPFLDGLHLSDASEFEHWLDAARVRLGRAAERALERLAIDAGQRRDHGDAADWWRRLTALDPLKADAVLRLMEALAAGGDRAAAVRVAERYAQRARAELDDDGSEAVAEYAGRLRGVSAEQRVTDRFVIERQVGRGASAVFYLARDTKHDRRVTLAMLHPELGTAIERDRLAGEIRAIGRLQHPHILPLLDSGEWADTLYYITPFVDGESLRARLTREQRLPIADLLTITRQVADALAHAHHRDVVHGDVTAEHVVLADGHATLTDFGIARLTSSARATAGAPNDRARAIADDLFALGSLLFEMLAGQAWRPDRGSSSRRAAPATDRLRALRPDTPPWLDDLVGLLLHDDPSCRPTTAALVTQLLATGASAPPSRLPMAGDAMLGRERELATAGALLDRPDVALVTLTGAGGVGKTRLAIEIARARAAQRDRVYFVDLSPVSEPAAVGPAIASALGLRLDGDQDAFVALAAVFTGRRVLLVLDNFEQVVGAAPAVTRLAAAAPSLDLLVTSRLRLGVAGEHELRVAPLAVPDDGEAAPALRDNPAVRLFVRRASDASASLVFDDDAVRTAARICARLDGLPLAIELAAARCRVMSPRAVATRLEAGLGLLSGGGRNTPERHQTMRGAVAWSHALLRPDEQRLFARMAVFAGGCTLAAAEAVCGDADARADALDALDALGALVDASVLVRAVPAHGGEPRFQMLETVREFALERLGEDGDAPRLADRHAAWYGQLATSLAPQLTGEAQHEALGTLAGDHANLSAALEHALEHGDAAAALSLGAALWRYWLVRGHLLEGRARLGRALALPTAAEPALDGRRADVLTGAGHLAQNNGAAAQATRYFRDALVIRQRLGDRAGVASALADLGWMRWRQCDFGEARRLSHECLTIAREVGATRVAALALTNLGISALFEGKLEEARSMLEQSAALRAEVADGRGVAFANTLVAWALCRAGLPERAHALLDGAELVLRALDDRRLIYLARDVRAELFLRAGNAARAATLLELDSISGQRRFGDRWSVAHGLALASWASRLLGRVAEAAAFAEESLELRRAEGDRYGEAESLALLAAAARLTGDDDRATALVQASRGIRVSIGDAAGVADCDAELARAGAPA